MVSKKAAVGFTIIGGVFYVIGGLTLARSITVGVLPVGLLAGIIIITGGVLISSKSRAVREAGGVLAIIAVLFALVNGCGGLLVGLVLTLAGSISGIRYKAPQLSAQGLLNQAPLTVPVK